MIYMKKNYLYLFALLLILAACKKNTYNITDREGMEGKAMVKVGIFNMTASPSNLLIYVNGERLSSAILPPYPYPGSGLNTNGPTATSDYLALTPGTNKLQYFTTNPGTINTISEFFKGDFTVEANKKYTVYTTDTAANAIAITAPDDAVAPDSGFSRIRFINLMPNVAAVDFYKGTTLLKSGVKYKEYTDFFDIVYGSDSFSVRVAGAAPGSALSALGYRVIAPSNRRIYSFLSRGYLGTTGTRAPSVSAIINQ
jgi:hypothetical protein